MVFGTTFYLVWYHKYLYVLLSMFSVVYAIYGVGSWLVVVGNDRYMKWKARERVSHLIWLRVVWKFG